MTLADLIQQLNDLAEELGSDTEVRLATGPSWPFENTLSQVVAVNLSEPVAELFGPEDDEDFGEEDEPNYPENDEFVVYLSEGRQLGYLPDQAKSQLGWSNR